MCWTLVDSLQSLYDTALTDVSPLISFCIDGLMKRYKWKSQFHYFFQWHSKHLRERNFPRTIVIHLPFHSFTCPSSFVHLFNISSWDRDRFSFLFISLIRFEHPYSERIQIHANLKGIEMTRCTETGTDSQFGHWMPSVNLLFNRTIFVSHANVSNWESVTQIFPVNWWHIGVVSDRIYANIDVNHVTTLSILLSFWCPERRKFNLIIYFLKELSDRHLPHNNNFQESVRDSYHVGHLNMSVRRLIRNHDQITCVVYAQITLEYVR